MRLKAWMGIILCAVLAAGTLAGCAAAPTNAATSGLSQIANPWQDATPAEAAKVLGGTFYNFSTLGSDYQQYALMVTTDDAVKKGSQPCAWVRFRKGDEDISLQMFKGGKPDFVDQKGTKVAVNGADAYYADNGDGTAQISWEANGVTFLISTSTAWSQADLVSLATGVSAVH